MNSTSPIQPKLLSSINERLVMRALLEQGPLTRSEMSRSIGVTFPTVNKAVASLLTAKLLEEFDGTPGGPGRPAKRLRLAVECSQVIGATLSHEKCHIAAASLDGVLRGSLTEQFATPDSYEGLLDAIAEHVSRLIDSGADATLCIGVNVPGVVDYKEQRVVMSANLPIVNGESIGVDLSTRLGVECIVVRDAHAFSLSERLKHRGAEEHGTIAMLDHSEGIGLGLIIQREFLTGERGFAGELGHIPVVADGDACHCGNIGCLETVASEWSVENRISEAVGRRVTIDEVLDMVVAGDATATTAVEEMCDQLARGVAVVVNLFNPGLFYIYGQSFKVVPGLLDRLIAETKRYALPPSFESCRFERASGDEMNGTIAGVINYLTESLVPDLEGGGKPRPPAYAFSR